MVYTGPSKGCASCRKRRVKCDQVRPVCANCMKRALACGGYPDVSETGIRWRDETQAVASAATHGYGWRKGVRPATAAGLDVSLPQDPTTLALCFFFNNYVVLGKDPHAQGLTESLEPIYPQRNDGSAMYHAISAVSFALMGLWLGRGTETPNMENCLGLALRALSDDLSDPKKSVSDDTMTAVLLLQYLESLTAHTKIQKAAGQHQNGCIALVKHRGISSFQSDRAKQLLQYIRQALVSAALRSKRTIPLDSALWAAPGQDDLLATLDQLGARVANLQAFETAMDKKNKQDGQQLITAASKLDADLVSWENNLPVEWQPRLASGDSCIPASVTKAGLYGNECAIYASIQLASRYNTFRGYRLMVLTSLLEYSGREDTVSVLAVKDDIQQLVDQICQTVPMHLGDRTTPGHISDFLEARVHFASTATVEQDAFSRVQKDKFALAMGVWYMLGPLSLLVDLFSIPGNAHVLRDGQMDWIKGQLLRSFVLQGMKPPPELQGEMHVDVVAEAKNVRQSLRFTRGA